jgi:hypothetical protein
MAERSTRTIWVLASIAVLAAVAILRVSRASADLSNEGSWVATRIRTGFQGLEEEGVVGWRGPDFVQEYTLESDGSFLVVDRERDAGTNEWKATAYSATPTYTLEAIDNSGRDCFALASVDSATGETVLERWELVARGTDPAANAVPKAFLRTPIYRGRLQAPTIEIGFDPDRRFFLLLAGPQATRSLYQIPARPGALPVLLYDADAQPVLSQAWMMNALQHAALGRIWLVSGMTRESRGETLVLVDTENDGTFDPPPIADSQETLEGSGLLDPAQIVDAFTGE